MRTPALAARASRGRSADRSFDAATSSCPTDAAIEFPIERFARYCLLNGVDELGFLLAQEREIARLRAAEAGMKARIAVLAGDGIGPEVIAEAVRVLQAVATPLRASVRAAGAALRRRRDRSATVSRCPPATLAGLSARRRGAAGRNRRPASGPRRRPRCGPKRACCGCARSWASMRTCARCACIRRCAAPRRSSPR